MGSFANKGEQVRFVGIVGVIAGLVAFWAIIVVLALFNLKQPVSVVVIAAAGVAAVGAGIWASRRFRAERSGKPSVTQH
ncbi:hypothetical protein GCM10022223_03220 [Kineosporia mesophila]|uniref:Secreted protein with PEP-CTERM sorting signal n=1 Tax=Kineosporia mesophila TaxID=566012 RepID=A0ABP6YWA4_9ACTN|nr:hypothetical protein [Kineosporia mesophila]MCD5351808.1 hypothetical protein [Kineosporia mesophila]